MSLARLRLWPSEINVYTLRRLSSFYAKLLALGVENASLRIKKRAVCRQASHFTKANPQSAALIANL